MNRCRRSLTFVASLSVALGLVSCVGTAELRRGGPEAAYTGPVITANDGKFVRFEGRIAANEKGDVRLSWAGTAASVRFRGTAVSADITDNGKNHFLVLVDGKPKREKLTPVAGRSTLSLAKGLPRGEHTVTLYKLNEPLVGTSTLHAFIVDEYGEPLVPQAAPSARIEIIGDSISTGYGNEGENQSCGFSPETQNHFLTYGARAARDVGATLTTLAWSGKGVFSNRGVASDPETMSSLWTRSLPAEGLDYEFDEAPPQAVLINLGTNDFAPEVEDTTPFAAAYDALLKEVRQKYAKTEIIVAVGPLLSDSYPEGKSALTTVRSTLHHMVERRRKEGDAHVHFLEFAAVQPNEGFGCDFHPSEKTHRRMAATLVKTLREKAGF